MILSFKKKEIIVQRVREIAHCAVSAVVATLEGIKVNEITQLRQEARNIGVYIFVIRNTLLHRVVEGTAFLCLKSVFVGQNIVAFSSRHPSDSARVFLNFNKKNESFQIKGAAFEGKFLDTSQINFLSNLSTYEESLRGLIVVMKMNSIGSLMRILYVLSTKK